MYYELYSKIFPNDVNVKTRKTYKNIKNTKDPFTKCKIDIIIPTNNEINILNNKSPKAFLYKDVQYEFDIYETSNDLFTKISIAYEIKHPPVLTNINYD